MRKGYLLQYRTRNSFSGFNNEMGRQQIKEESEDLYIFLA